MSVLIKVFNRCIIGVLTLGMLGCGCLFPSTPNTLPNVYVDLYSEANNLKHIGKYSAAVEKYEQAFKIRPRPTKIIDVRFPALLKYQIAFCYAKFAEAEGDALLYTKAEAAIRESYQTAILPNHQAHILYLWGYILFKQGRYEEAGAKFKSISIPRASQYGDSARLMWDGSYALGKTYLGLDDETAARQAFRQLDSQIDAFLQDDGWPPTVGRHILYALGKAYLELGDETAARRVFTMRETLFYTDPEEDHPHTGDEVLYAFGKAYLELGDEAAARLTFTQLEELIKTYPHPWYPYVRKEVLYGLGKAYLELGEEAAARRVFAQLEELIKTYLQNGWPYVGTEVLYGLGKTYLELGEEAAARLAFTRLLRHYPNTSYKAEVKRLLKEQ